MSPTLTPTNWSTTITRYYQNDPDAFEEIFNYWFPRLVSHAQLRGMSSEDAQDIAAEALLKVARTRDKSAYDPSKGAAFSTWIYRIALNVLLDKRRGNIRTPTVPAEECFGPGLYRASGTLDDPHETGSYRQLSGALEECLSHVEPASREAFVMKVLEGFSLHEVVEAIGGNVTGVHRNINRARAALQDCLTVKGFAQEATA